MRRTFPFIALLVAALASSACSTAPRQTAEAPPAAQPQAAAAPRANPSAVKGLSPSEKRASIASDFPAEVPAPVGAYTDVVAQAGVAWDYTVEVDARAIDLRVWYLQAYTGRSWRLVDEGKFDDASGAGTFATLRKGSAESHVKVYGDPEAQPTRAVVTVGVGAAVLETQ